MDTFGEGTDSVWFEAQKIVIQLNMSLRTIAIMLRGLWKLEFGTDRRTFLGTPHVTPVRSGVSRKYVHFGLEEYMKRILKGTVAPVHVIIELQLHVSVLSPFTDFRKIRWLLLYYFPPYFWTVSNLMGFTSKTFGIWVRTCLCSERMHLFADSRAIHRWLTNHAYVRLNVAV